MSRCRCREVAWFQKNRIQKESAKTPSAIRREEETNLPYSSCLTSRLLVFALSLDGTWSGLTSSPTTPYAQTCPAHHCARKCVRRRSRAAPGSNCPADARDDSCRNT